MRDSAVVLIFVLLFIFLIVVVVVVFSMSERAGTAHSRRGWTMSLGLNFFGAQNTFFFV